MNSLPFQLDEVLAFWFDETSPSKWWSKSDTFDQMIATRFGPLLAAASQCELAHWRDTPTGRLAEIIVLDQFSRNIYRDQAAAFACDPLALALAQTAVTVGADRELDSTRRPFLLMPYMHSESRRIHVDAVRVFDVPGMETTLAFELKHKAIIDRFGRYPHRNAALGRASTLDEIEFLRTPGSSF